MQTLKYTRIFISSNKINLRVIILLMGCTKFTFRLERNKKRYIFIDFNSKNDGLNKILRVLVLGIVGTYQCVLDNALNAHAAHSRLIKVRELQKGTTSSAIILEKCSLRNYGRAIKDTCI